MGLRLNSPAGPAAPVTSFKRGAPLVCRPCEGRGGKILIFGMTAVVFYLYSNCAGRGFVMELRNLSVVFARTKGRHTFRLGNRL
jgi:hypothetical protein